MQNVCFVFSKIVNTCGIKVLHLNKHLFKKANLVRITPAGSQNSAYASKFSRRFENNFDISTLDGKSLARKRYQDCKVGLQQKEKQNVEGLLNFLVGDTSNLLSSR